MKIDLSSLREVREYAHKSQRQYNKLDLLINNAGIMMSPYKVTEDGIEKQLATNTSAILPLLACCCHIASVIWEKFIFISSLATATAYYDTSIGPLLADSQKAEVLRLLIEEVKQVALARHITIPEDITEKALTKLASLPPATTSSMHSDFKSRKSETELESLTGYVVRTGQQLGVATPAFARFYQELKTRGGS